MDFRLAAVCCLVSALEAWAGEPSRALACLESKVAPWLLGDLPIAALLDPSALPSVGSEPLLVAILPSKSDGGLEIDVGTIAAAGGEVLRQTPDLVIARVPLRALAAIAEAPSVGFIRPPFRPQLSKTAAVKAVGATAWHSLGFRGQGVKVGLIDVEFGNYNQVFFQIGLTGYKTWAPSGSTFGGDPKTGQHGTGCTEVLYAVAPGAELYLAQVGSDTFEADFPAALDWVTARGVSVVSVSLGLPGWYYDDGTSPVAKAVDAARKRGVLVFVAAGNEGENYYWTGTFRDADADGFHDFTSSDEGNDVEIGAICMGLIMLTWDGGERTSEDLDLIIRDRITKATIAQSNTRQTGSQPSLEALVFVTRELELALLAQGMTMTDLVELFPRPVRPAVLDPCSAEIVVKRVSTRRDPKMRLCSYVEKVEFRGNKFTTTRVYPQYASQDRSIRTPGDAKGAITVGAVELGDWDAGKIAVYSSRGPTADGRVKPDVVGPSALSTLAYGTETFRGTSCGTPVSAGAAAILFGVCPGASADFVESFIRKYARDLGTAGLDATSGAGALRLPEAASHRPFRRGYVDRDDKVKITDAVVLLNHLFVGGEEPDCLDAADTDDSGRVDLADAVALLNYLFLGGRRSAGTFRDLLRGSHAGRRLLPRPRGLPVARRTGPIRAASARTSARRGSRGIPRPGFRPHPRAASGQDGTRPRTRSCLGARRVGGRF